jgi:hypothetical protein
MKRIKWTTEEDKKLRELLNNNYRSKDIGIILNRTKKSIDSRKKNLKIKKSRPLTNESFFESIDTEAKAYFLGLMYADGCVNIAKFGQKRMSINLHHQDKHILETFKQKLGLKYELQFNQHSKRKNKFNIQDQYVLRVNSDKLCNDLINLGCVPRKSLILNFPTFEQVPENFMRHFIRGLFDGDGGIYSKFTELNKNIPRFKFEITGTYDICNGINNLFYKLFNFKPLKLLLHRNIYKYSLGGNFQIEKVFNYLYNNCDSELYLIRKYNVFKTILNYDVKPIIKTSKYRYISYRKLDIKKWQIIKYNGRKMFCLGKFETEFEAYIGLCKYEEQNKLPFSNDITDYIKFNQ